ncbi:MULTISPECIES: helix-turn-helix domain-containing protein [Mycobacteriaceae]|uniref:XRE family transcriptional regulator n=1 Tax=Mycolicibacterium neoaurum VKM Ac-1815D TaxID=700508 RepID=V5X682_MYCNE|nr:MULTISPECIES: XRE family transcriptional regulator [Mycobacteriaceae]AHC23522.1 XRE family transcriptional regulator [Mycolicibacterium neoaurum VKM Ac-1815D]AMO04221.1 XRE family transcriptional regulator [Mycolicibacterium neoaurum]AXK77497.1 XRE family transcriptional regulator [Mycolicibacterium neoaurum]KJQ48666.1 XRE family transcriptional regulator [Mycolicibacterium neoaurum]KUM08707.1 XRE family transcriptional regulator [Mycolicibacterium neoaurum]
MTAGDIGRQLRDLRAERGLSLSELARRAGVGKGSLSEIEAGKRNPTIETLYALCAPLDVPLTALVGEVPGVHSAAAGGMRAVLLSVRNLARATVEVFRLEFPAGADHVSPPHGVGSREHLTVVAGRVLVGPIGEETLIEEGQALSWSSDRRHRYAAIDGAAEAVVVITTSVDGRSRE